MIKNKLLTMKEICAWLKCCARTIKRLIIEENLPAILFPGNRWRFDTTEVSIWLKKRKIKN